jgi:uncharacterized caspase-like protein
MLVPIQSLEASMRRLTTFLAAVIAICCASQSALADKRVAFVVGNSDYKNVTALPNPVNDAAAIAQMFRKASFDVVESRRDLTNYEMRRALRDFTEKASDADVAVIYYAGHGIEVDGNNYLIPVDAALERDTDAYDEAIGLDRILQAIEPAKQLRLVILDACRDNPFAKTMKRTVASRSLGRGLARVEPAGANTLIAFAAKGGSTAADGNSKNSPFTAALLKYLDQPGLELGKAFRLVRDQVMTATDNKQEPFVYGSLGGNDVALVPAPAAAPPPIAGADPNAAIRGDYELAERVGTKEAWDSFVAAHPSGFYTDLANAQRNKLAAEQARIAATEKARQAAEDRERLAAEGAKASEQAKADAQSKAAEEARLAAEKQKQVEEEKVAVAESAKKQGEATLASAEPLKPAADTPEVIAPRNADVASLAPSDSKPDRQVPPDLPRLLQSELRRVGCKTGGIDSEWNAAARKALSLFNDNAGTKLDVKLASIDALDAVRLKQERVCPLDCERGYRSSGDKCVKISCDDGYVLGANGSCQKRAVRPPNLVRSERRGGRICFVYNGASFCE